MNRPQRPLRQPPRPFTARYGVADEPRNREIRVSTEFTHEEISQMIGSSRETVTRLLSDMKRKDLIRQEGTTLVIPNRIALQAIAS